MQIVNPRPMTKENFTTFPVADWMVERLSKGDLFTIDESSVYPNLFSIYHFYNGRNFSIGLYAESREVAEMWLAWVRVSQ